MASPIKCRSCGSLVLIESGGDTCPQCQLTARETASQGSLAAPKPKRIALREETGTREKNESIPKRVGPYLIERVLGKGGMGEVFLGRDPDLGRRVAVKRVREGNSGDSELRQRFALEARLTARLQHPSIIPVYELSEDDGEFIYTMRPVGGHSLAEIIKKLDSKDSQKVSEWTAARLVRLFLQATNAIAYAHSEGVIHRDLKPANIMVGPFDEVVVLDWGAAKIIGADETTESVMGQAELAGLEGVNSSPGGLIGTPRYMAPEFLDRKPASMQTDIFALGVILYELLALKSPWQCNQFWEMAVAAQTPPPCPTMLQPHRRIPRRLVQVVMKALEPDPGRRYRTVAEFSKDVEAALEGKGRWIKLDTTGGEAAWRVEEGRLVASSEATALRSKGRRGLFRYVRRGAVSGSVRVRFDLRLPNRGRHRLGIEFAERSADPDRTDGYHLEVVAGKAPVVGLRRNGREVTGSKTSGLRPKQWYRVSAEKLNNRISLTIGNEEIYAFVDLVPLRTDCLSLEGRSDGIQVRNLEVQSQGVSANVSCLAVPDAFFNRKLYEEARQEYRRIASSLPGRQESRQAGFRAGLCLVEEARREKDSGRQRLLLREAEKNFTESLSRESSCLLELGIAMVSAERGNARSERRALERAFKGFKSDPDMSAVRDWILSRLHMAAEGGSERKVIAELMPLALLHCLDGAGERVVKDVMPAIRQEWEMPPFMESRLRGRVTDGQFQAEAFIFFGFWSASTEFIGRGVEFLIEYGLLDSHRTADAFFAFLELDALGKAKEILRRGVSAAGDAGPLEELFDVCQAAVLAVEGNLEKALRLWSKLRVNHRSRGYNSARLILANACVSVGRKRDALRVLTPASETDWLAREHRAWIYLDGGNHKAAERELKPMVDCGMHREGHNLINFLHGISLLMAGREIESFEVFSCLPHTRWPRTWTLGSYYAAGRLSGGNPEDYIKNALPWERRQLYRHLALLKQVSGEKERAAEFSALARTSLIGGE